MAWTKHPWHDFKRKEALQANSAKENSLSQPGGNSTTVASGLLTSFVVPFALRSCNPGMGRHWSKKAKLARLWKTYVRAFGGMGPRVDFPCRVEVHLCSAYAVDPGNRAAAAKPVLDALVFWKWLKDDSDQWLDFPTPTLVRVRSRKLERTEIKVWRLS